MVKGLRRKGFEMGIGLERQDIFNVVKDSLEEVAETNNIAIKESISEKTPLYGEQGYLDSIALVGLTVSIEEKLSHVGHDITIASEKAFSRKIGPFLNVRTLANFIEELLNEQSANNHRNK
jgi:acyl carrier protein